MLDKELGSLGSMDARRPEVPRLTPEELDLCTNVIAEHVAHLEQIPTADLSTAALRRLTLVAIEVSGADPLGGEQLHTLGSEHHPAAEPSTTRSTPTRRPRRSPDEHEDKPTYRSTRQVDMASPVDSPWLGDPT
jgi:hypothetical protein